MAGDVGSYHRIRLLAESGLGKSTLFIAMEHQIASKFGDLVPLRLVAGPASCSRDDLGRWNRLPLLSDFDWNQPVDVVLAELAERLLGDFVGDRHERELWLQTAISRGDIIFLLDAIDQTDRLLKLDRFFNSDGIRFCPALLSGRPETLRTRQTAYAGVEWLTLWVDPFDDTRIVRFWDDAPMMERLLRDTGWTPLREVPILLSQMKQLALNGLLQDLPNREAVHE